MKLSRLLSAREMMRRMRACTLLMIGVLAAISAVSCPGQKAKSQPKLKGWGSYIDGTNKFAVKFPPGCDVLVEDQQWLKGAGGMQDEEASISFRNDMMVFSIVMYPNPQHLSAKQWFDKDVKDAGKSWGGKWSIIAAHPITINGQEGYTALMKMPDSKDKRTFFTWGERAYMIYYSKWWPLMTVSEQKNYESRYAVLESMLHTFKKID